MSTRLTQEQREELHGYVVGSDTSDLLTAVERILNEGQAKAWGEGARTALNHSVRNPDGITLSLDKPNPYHRDRKVNT